MKKTLGGDRLGSGKKMEVDLHGYNRSTHDLGYLWRSTMSAGTLVPFMSQVGLPGDTFDIDLNADVKTHPTVGPLFGSYKTQLDVFMIPMRLYNSYLHNNKIGIGMKMANVKLPVIALRADPIPNAVADAGEVQNSQINPSCLLAYLGIRGVGFVGEGQDSITRSFNAIPLLGYWDIYKQYYANKQEESGYVIHAFNNPAYLVPGSIEAVQGGAVLAEYPATGQVFSMGMNLGYREWKLNFAAPPSRETLKGVNFNFGLGATQQMNLYDIIEPYVVYAGNTATVKLSISRVPFNLDLYTWSLVNNYTPKSNPPQLVKFGLINIDEMREAILAYGSTVAPFVVNEAFLNPYEYYDWVDDINPMLNSQEGLGVKTYQSDLFNNWLSTEWIDGTDGVNNVTRVDTSAGSFEIDQLNLAKKVYDMLNRIAVSGGTYDDWIDAVYANERHQRAENPVYMGGLSKELVFQEVVSNSDSEGQPLGTLAGKGVMAKKHKGGKIIVKCDEPCYIMGIVSLTPRIDYSQGNSWDTGLRTLNDLHKPALDEIGFQDLITEQMAWWSTSNTSGVTWTQRSAGKQPAWVNYMTNVNKTFGNFAIPDNEMFMTLNRRYEFARTNLTGRIKDLTTYIDPTKFNFIFADTAIDAQNFWVQISVDIMARRVMSAKVMPNL